MMGDAESVPFTASTQATTAAPNRRSLATVAGGGAVIGALAGVIIAVLLTVGQGAAVMIASAFDVAAGMALIGGLIGANIAGTD